MTQPPVKFPWLRLVGAIVSNLPAVKQALGETLSGLDRSPELVKFIEGFQRVDQKDCLICLGYQLGRDKGVTTAATPEHWCPTRENASLCGCGKPGVRHGMITGRFERKVCVDFPGCIPKSKSTRTT